MSRLLKWQTVIIKKVTAMSNAKLLEETLDLPGGDAHDGCWTNRCCWEYQVLEEELKDRLEEWLKKDA